MNQKLQIEFRRLGFILVNKRPYKSIVRGAFLCEICIESKSLKKAARYRNLDLEQTV